MSDPDECSREANNDPDLPDCMNCGVCEFCIERSIAAAEEQDDRMLEEIQKLNQNPPIDMVLHCPVCRHIHVDAPEPETGWDNPPHRSHKCHYCGCIWRPADVTTNGVHRIKTRGEKDTWPDSKRPVVDPTTVCCGHGPHATGPPCCENAGQYNGYGSDGPTVFTCPKSCSCHD